MQKTQHNDQTQAHSTKNIVHTCIPTSYNLGTEWDVKMYLRKDFLPLIDFVVCNIKDLQNIFKCCHTSQMHLFDYGLAQAEHCKAHHYAMFLVATLILTKALE